MYMHLLLSSVHLKIEETSRMLRTGDLGIPPNPADRYEPSSHPTSACSNTATQKLLHALHAQYLGPSDICTCIICMCFNCSILHQVRRGVVWTSSDVLGAGFNSSVLTHKLVFSYSFYTHYTCVLIFNLIYP